MKRARVHHAARRRGGGVAARGAGAAAGDAGDRVSQQPIADAAYRLRAFRQGLKETGYVEGQNVAIEYRWADDHHDQLPALARDLVRRQVAVIAATGHAAFAAKAATTTMPIVLSSGDDPVRLGLVASLTRPGGNLTGVNFFGGGWPQSDWNCCTRSYPRSRCRSRQSERSRCRGRRREMQNRRHARWVNKSNPQRQHQPEIDAAFATLVSERPDALRRADAFFNSRRVHWCSGSSSCGPRDHVAREFADSRRSDELRTELTDTYRQVGVYAGRILKGAKPEDLPVVQSTKFELVINLETARMLGLTSAAIAARPRRRGHRMNGASSSR